MQGDVFIFIYLFFLFFARPEPLYLVVCVRVPPRRAIIIHEEKNNKYPLEKTKEKNRTRKTGSVKSNFTVITLQLFRTVYRVTSATK